MALFRVEDSLPVRAPLERCFLLATSIQLVEKTIGMKPVEGKTHGLIVNGDRLVWRGWKFGLPAMHETLITGYDRPSWFQDTQGRGRFKFFQHDHHFTETDGQTLMHDCVRFELPFGMLGDAVARLILVPHVTGLLKRRFALLKQLAESNNEWQPWLTPEA